MNAPNVSSILDRPSDTFERPKAYPIGDYDFVIKGLPRQDVSSQKKTPFLEFQLQLTAAREDVDQEALQGMGGLRADKPMKTAFYLTEEAAYRLTEFLNAVGAGDEEESLRQRVAKTPNCTGIVTIKHSPTKDGKGVFAECAAFAPSAD